MIHTILQIIGVIAIIIFLIKFIISVINFIKCQASDKIHFRYFATEYDFSFCEFHLIPTITIERTTNYLNLYIYVFCFAYSICYTNKLDE